MLGALRLVRRDIPWCKREIAEYQAAVLFALVRQYNREGVHILEIGTALGYSAAVMARAAPLATIVTLNPKEEEWPRAIEHLDRVPYERVAVVPLHSWEYLESYVDAQLDVVFVDGDHGQVARDLAWWEHIKVGGLMLFHDYTPYDAGRRPCQPVYGAVNAFAGGLGREPDVLVIDDAGEGMAGFYRRAGEPLPPLKVDKLLWHLDVRSRLWVPGAA
jgi:predicted O-methyltransferase YrrM